MVSTKVLWMGGVKELNAAWIVPLSPWRGTWEVVIKGDGEVDLYRCRSLEPACRSVSVSPCTWSQVVMHFCLERVGWGRGKELHTAVSFLSAWVDGMEACHSDAPVGSAWLDHVEACYLDVPVGSPLQLLSPLGSGIPLEPRLSLPCYTQQNVAEMGLFWLEF